MLKGIKLTDRIEVPTQRTITDAGQMIVPCAFARTGSQTYTAGSLGLDGDPQRLVELVRDEADVFAEDTMESFRSAPVTIGHPKDADGHPVAVSADNSKELQVGMLEGMPARDEDLVTGTLVIARQDAIDLIDEGTQELSAGYTCDIEAVIVDGEEVLYQRNIKANHIAIVERGRAGSSCRIADEDEPEAKVVEKVVEKVVQDEALVARVEAQDELIADLKVQLSTFDQRVEDAVQELSEVVLVAKDLTDINDFKGKSVADIKREVVAFCKPQLTLDGRSDEYVSARYEILLEDQDKAPTQMERLMADQLNQDTAPIVVKDPVAEARQNMINRNKGIK